MSRCTITCPHCGFSKDVAQDPALLQGTTVTCPKCKKAFPFAAPEPVSPQATAQPAPAPESGPVETAESQSTPPHKFCPTCGSPIHIKAEICPKCGVRVAPPRHSVNKIALLVITFFLGGLGGHKFYLKKYLQGVLYLLFFWTYIPTLVALIEFIIYACKSEEELQEKYPQTSAGAIFVVLFVPVLFAVVGILAALAIPQFAAYRQKASNAAARSALVACQQQVMTYYVDNGTLPSTPKELSCRATDAVSLYYLSTGADDYQLISFSEYGNKAFLITNTAAEIVEVEKLEMEAELTTELGAIPLSPGFHFVE